MEKNTIRNLPVFEELKRSKEEALAAIKEFVDDIYDIIKNLEQVSIQEVEDAFHEMELMFDQEMTDTDREIVTIDHCGKDSQVFEECKENARDNLNNIVEGTMIKSSETNSKSMIIFSEDSNICDTLRQFKSLGSVMNTKSRTSAYSVQNIQDINVRLPNDSGTCNVSDTCLIGHNMLLIVDNANKKLKRFHITQMSIVDQCDLSSHPYCVSAVGKQEVAVTMSSNTVQFVLLGETMTLSRKLNFNHCCYGIAYKGDVIYVTDSSCSLYIYNMEGQILQKVSHDTSGNNLFNHSRQIVICDNENKLYVSDRTNRVTILDLEGKHVDTFVDVKLDQVNGICTDGSGNIFVCGYASRNVIQIGQNLKKKMIIARPADGLENPYSLCFAPGHCIMFVSQGNSDRVKAFQLK